MIRINDRLILSKVKKIFTRKIRLPVSVALIIVLVIGLFFNWYQKRYYERERAKTDPKIKEAKMIEEVNSLTREISTIMTIPDETPSVMTVSDVEKLKTGDAADFFKNAQSGDKVLIFNKAQKAILYRPQDKKILEVTTLKIN